LKIALQDKKAVGAFLNREPYEGRVLTSDGDALTAKWGKLPLVAKWDKRGKLVLIPTEDRGVKKAQDLIVEMRS
jgi:hypothetical protein